MFKLQVIPNFGSFWWNNVMCWKYFPKWENARFVGQSGQVWVDMIFQSYEYKRKIRRIIKQRNLILFLFYLKRKWPFWSVDKQQTKNIRKEIEQHDPYLFFLVSITLTCVFTQSKKWERTTWSRTLYAFHRVMTYINFKQKHSPILRLNLFLTEFQ